MLLLHALKSKRALNWLERYVRVVVALYQGYLPAICAVFWLAVGHPIDSFQTEDAVRTLKQLTGFIEILHQLVLCELARDNLRHSFDVTQFLVREIAMTDQF